MTEDENWRRKDIAAAKRYHKYALAWADQGATEKQRGRIGRSMVLYRRALECALVATFRISPYFDFEPTRSAIHRSAACFAMGCDETAYAEIFVETGLAGNPPAEIAAELRQLRDSLAAIPDDGAP